VKTFFYELQFQIKHNLLSFLIIYVRGKNDQQSAYLSMIYWLYYYTHQAYKLGHCGNKNIDCYSPLYIIIKDCFYTLVLQ